MKKNLRIVSAAAAALLAVAPVAATAIATPATTSVAQAATNGRKYSTWTYDELKDALKKQATVANGKVSGVESGEGTAELSKIVNGKYPFTSGTVKYEYGNDVKWGSLTVTRNGQTLNPVSGRLYATDKDGKAYSYSAQQVVYLPIKVVGTDAVNLTEGQHVPVANGVHAVATKMNGQWYAKADVVFTPTTLRPENNSTAESENPNAYFTAKATLDTSDGTVLARHALANNREVTALPQNSKAKSLAGLRAAIEKTIGFHDYNNAGESFSENSAWLQFVFGDENSANATNNSNLKSQLQNQGINVDANGNFNAGSNSYKIVVRSNGGLRVTVVFQNTDAVNLNNPAFSIRSDKWSNTAVSMNQYAKTSWTAGFNDPEMVPTINLYKRDNGKFNPLDYIEALKDRKTNATISYTVNSNDVDWTKVGLYHVNVTATYGTHTTTLTIPVVVNDTNGKLMSAIKDTNYYRLDGTNLVQANLTNNVLHEGDQIHVFGNAVTKKLNGQDVQVYQVAGPTSNLYVLASDLKDGVVNNTPAQETTKTVTIMHISTIYDKNGKATHEPALRAYDTYSVVSTPVNLKDEKGKDAGMFYKLAGKDQYIKVGNVDGTSRSLKHNSYVYKSTGKRNGKKVLKKGSSVTTYGKSFMIAGHQMYRIGKNQYVKKANF